jgi:hypothetical protein
MMANQNPLGSNPYQASIAIVYAGEQWRCAAWQAELAMTKSLPPFTRGVTVPLNIAQQKQGSLPRR